MEGVVVVGDSCEVEGCGGAGRDGRKVEADALREVGEEFVDIDVDDVAAGFASELAFWLCSWT